MINLSEIVEVKKTIYIPKNSYWKNGKMVTVKAHKRTVTTKKKRMTKDEYRKDFEKRPIREQRKDRSRTAKNTLVRGNVAFVSPNDDSVNIDWLGVDAKGFEVAPTGSKQTKLTKGMPENYSVVKFEKNGKVKYRPRFKGKNIGQTRFHTSYKNALKQVKQHNGRLTGIIKNNRAEDIFEKMEHNLWKGQHHGDEIRRDKDLFDSSVLDESLYYDEKLNDFKSKFNMSNADDWHRM